MLRGLQADSMNSTSDTIEDAQRLYFRVFRPCIQFIKQSHHRGRDICGKPIGRDYSLLKDCLPSRNQLAYGHWLELRRRCRGG